MRRKKLPFRTLKVILTSPFGKGSFERNVFLSGPVVVPWQDMVEQVVLDCLHTNAVFKQHPLNGKPVVRVATKKGDTYFTVDVIPV